MRKVIGKISLIVFIVGIALIVFNFVRISQASYLTGTGAVFIVSGATYNTTTPLTWTDLDLSGVVGSNSAWVILSIHANSDINAVAVRKNGDTTEYYNAAADASAQGMALAHHASTNAVVLSSLTDNAGVIEWISETAVANATVTVISYIKQ